MGFAVEKMKNSNIIVKDEALWSFEVRSAQFCLTNVVLQKGLQNRTCSYLFSFYSACHLIFILSSYESRKKRDRAEEKAVREF